MTLFFLKSCDALLKAFWSIHLCSRSIKTETNDIITLTIFSHLFFLLIWRKGLYTHTQKKKNKLVVFKTMGLFFCLQFCGKTKASLFNWFRASIERANIGFHRRIGKVNEACTARLRELTWKGTARVRLKLNLKKLKLKTF